MKVYKSCPNCGAVLKIDSAANGALTCPKCSNKCHTRELKDVPSITLICPQCRAGLKSYVHNQDFNLRCRQCGYEGAIATYGRYGGSDVSDQFEGNRDGHTQINHRVVRDGQRPAANVGGMRSGTVYDDEATHTAIHGGTVPKIPVYGRPLSLRLHADRDGNMWYGDKVLPRLKEGRQVIGRIGKSADIECPTRDLYFSRTHFAIEVEYNARVGSYRHYLCSNGHTNTIHLKQKGGTWIEVKANDMPVLNAGDLIRVGHTEFEVYYEVGHK